MFSVSKTAFFILAVFLIFPTPLLAQAVSGDVAARRAELESELGQLEKEIDVQRKILQAKQRESISLERDIAIFDAKIQAATLSIKARDIAIKKLSADISSKEATVSFLSGKIAREKDSLAQLLRKTNRLDSFSLVEVVLSNANLSEFFRDVESFAAIKVALQGSFAELDSSRRETKKEQVVLEGK